MEWMRRSCGDVCCDRRCGGEDVKRSGEERGEKKRGERTLVGRAKFDWAIAQWT